MINCISYGIILSIQVYRSKLIRPRIPFYNHSILKIVMDLILISDRYLPRNTIYKWEFVGSYTDQGGSELLWILNSLVNLQLVNKF